MKIFKRVLLVSLGLCLFSLGIFAGYTTQSIKNLTTNISKSNDDLGIDDESLDNINELLNSNNYNKDEIINIALFGIDSRDNTATTTSRSDSIMIATIDKKHNKIKLSSIMRDTYVSIDGHGKDKINHAYAFGGPQAAIKTLNQNFGLNITDFVTVNFWGLADIIDALGGIDVNVQSYEINEVNKYIKEVANIEKTTPKLISKAGFQTLTGSQAVAYGRIRKVGNGDYERTDRQRTIVIAMLAKLQSMNINQSVGLLNSVSSSITTSLSLSEMSKLAVDVLSNMKHLTVEQKRFPIDGEGKKINGIWYMVTDLEETKQSLYSFIYENSPSEDNTSTSTYSTDNNENTSYSNKDNYSNSYSTNTSSYSNNTIGNTNSNNSNNNYNYSSINSSPYSSSRN